MVVSKFQCNKVINHFICQTRALVLHIEAAGWGAAILAGTGAGVYPSAAAQAKQALHIERKVDPDLELKARYDEIYNGYQSLYPALREISRGLS